LGENPNKHLSQLREKKSKQAFRSIEEKNQTSIQVNWKRTNENKHSMQLTKSPNKH
jgi:hypothetical protein